MKKTKKEQKPKEEKSLRKRLSINEAESVAKKIKEIVSFVVVVSTVILGIITCYMNYYGTMSSVENDMQEMAKIAAKQVEWQITANKNIVQELGRMPRLSQTDNTVAERQELIDEKVKSYDCVRGKLIGMDGIAEVDGTDYNDREYFQRASKGETYVSKPLIAKKDGAVSVMIAAPVWKDGVPDTTIVGVVFLVMQSDILNNIVTDIRISENSSAYMLDEDGITIAHENADLVKNQSSTQEDAKTDSSLKKLAAMEAKMTAGEAGFGSYRYDGTSKLMAYAPIANTDGWSIALTAPKSDFMFKTYMGILITAILIIAFLIIGVVLAIKVGSSIGAPIKRCADRLNLLAAGDLHTPVPEINTKDETHVLSAATENLTEGMNSIIEDIKYILDEMAKGNFTVHTKREECYVGDFSTILESLREIKGHLSGTLSSIRESSEQVSLGSVQLSEGAQSLAEGATEQAGAVEELTATVENVTESARESAEKTSKAYRDISNAVIEAKHGTEDMNMLSGAMEKINQTSQEIQNIITDIENIASQTNLLSLNASIEAARAGEAGKGFAVVADQIGKLAADSAQSAVNTRELIVKSLEEIERGNQMSAATSEAFRYIIESMEKFSQVSQEVSETSNQQAQMLEQIQQGIEQIANVVQNNSASSEETSATSEELSAQAETMNQQIAKFVL